ncbi:MAG: indole-3-glycerol phosphate synthase TrpC [Pseudomonadota bacterium]
MSSQLDKILEHKRLEVQLRQNETPLHDLEQRYPSLPLTRGFAKDLSAKIQTRQPAVIAEIKKASPSKGIIRADFDPVWIAQRYAESGATCLSVLTDEVFFQGHDDYLQQIKAAVSIPLLRKEFIIDRYQIIESRILGADCILLIASALPEPELTDFAAYAFSLDLSVLVEIHSIEEWHRVKNIPNIIIGINNRNLHTFEIDLATTLEIAEVAASDGYDVSRLVSESGFFHSDDLKKMMQHGIFSFLIGESLMRQPDPGLALQQLMHI